MKVLICRIRLEGAHEKRAVENDSFIIDELLIRRGYDIVVNEKHHKNSDGLYLHLADLVVFGEKNIAVVESEEYLMECLRTPTEGYSKQVVDIGEAGFVVKYSTLFFSNAWRRIFDKLHCEINEIMFL